MSLDQSFWVKVAGKLTSLRLACVVQLCRAVGERSVLIYGVFAFAVCVSFSVFVLVRSFVGQAKYQVDLMG